MKNIFITIMYLLSLCAPTLVQAQVNKTVPGAIFPNASPVKNYVLNSNAEVNIKQITDASTIVTKGTPGLFDKADFKITATASGQKVKWPTVSFDPGVTGNCEAYGYLKGNASTYKTYVEDSSGNQLTVPFQLADYTAAQYSGSPVQLISIPYKCTSGSLMVIESTASGAAIDVDNVANGLPVHFGTQSVQQAQEIGTITFSACTAGSSWNYTTTTFALPSSTLPTSCTTVVTGAAQVPSTLEPAIKFASLGAGTYYLFGEGNFGQVTASKSGFFQFNDGTNAAREVSTIYSGGGQIGTTGINQSISYSTAQSNVQLNIYGKTDSSGTAYINYGTPISLTIRVMYLPSAASANIVYANTPPYPTYSIVTASSHSGGFSANGSGTYTTPQGVKYIRIRAVGGGGGGGGIPATSGSQNAVSGGGGGGGYTEHVINAPAATYAYVAGAGGTAGAAGANAGGTGGSTTFGTSLLTANGGTGGGAGSLGSATSYSVGGAGGGASGGNILNVIGSYGTSGYGTSLSVVIPGLGGGSFLSPSSGQPLLVTQVVNGAGPGGGASGNWDLSSGAATAGGVGASGEIIVEEVYNSPTAQAFVRVPPTRSIVTATSHSGGFSANSSGTYTPPAGVTYIEVKMIGGGGGGGGSGTATGTTAGTGGNTTFGSSFLTAGGGGAGSYGGGGGGGGTNTINSPAIDIDSMAGSNGGGANAFANTGIYESGGNGGQSCLGGAVAGTRGITGPSAFTNSGSGGSGAGIQNLANSSSGSGGASGACINIQLNFPLSATYTYSVGAAGTAGGAGTSGNAGGAGASGQIIVTEYYN